MVSSVTGIQLAYPGHAKNRHFQRDTPEKNATIAQFFVMHYGVME
jgi:hypothetical protein